MRATRIRKWFAFLGMLAAFMLIVAACNTDDDNGETGEAELDRPIHFGEQAHDSYLVLNAIARLVAEEGYGYETESTQAETVAVWQAVTTGEMDVAMEIWVDQVPEWEEAVDDGVIQDLGTAIDESVQGWFVPTYVIEGDEERGIEPMAPGLSHVDDLPEYWEVFQDPDDPDKGRFYDCIPGWECEQVNRAKLQAYGLDEYYNRFLPGSGAALATSIVSAYESGEPWFGYYWGPTWIFEQVDLTMLEEPEYSDECWNQLIDAIAAEEVPTEACAYPTVPVHIAVHVDFPDLAPDYAEFLENVDFTMDQISAILLYMYENDASGQEGAYWFMRENEDLWSDWMPEDVAERVREALDS